MTLEVRLATAAEVRRLRRDVLRPAGTLDPAAYDLMPATVHIGAFDGDVVVGCATVFPSPYDDEPDAWQLRGMAVDPARQGDGIGRLVLEATVHAATTADAPLLWARGRVTALGFYTQLGWHAVGEEYAYGPEDRAHFTILRSLSGSRRRVVQGDFPR